MADKISEIVDQSAFEQVSKLKSELGSLGDTLQSVFKNALQLNEVLGGGDSLAALRQGAGNATKAVTELEKYTKQLVSTNEKLALSEHDVKKQLDEARMALQASNQASKDAIKLKQSEEGSISSMRLQLKSLQAQYDNLSASQRNAMGKTLLTDIQRVNSELRNLEQETGRNTRNVDNYGSVLSKAWGFIRQAAYILPGIGIAGIFTLAGEAVLALMDKLQIFNSQAKEMKQTLYEGFNGGEVKAAIETFNKLENSIDLVHKGLMTKKEGLDQYNNTLGEVAGKVNTWDEAEEMIKKKASAWIKMVELKAQANALLAKSAELETESLSIDNKEPGWGTKILAWIKGSNFMVSNWGKSYDEMKKKEDAYLAESNHDDKVGLETKAKIYKDAWMKLSNEIESLMNQNNFKDPEIKQPKVKEINRIEDLNNEFEKEKLAIDKRNADGLSTELDYRNQLTDLNNEFINVRLKGIDKLSDKEEKSSTDFQKKILNENKQNVKAVEDYYKNIVKIMDDYDKEIKRQDAENIKDIEKNKKKIEELDKEEEAQTSGRIKRIIDEKEKAAKRDIELKHAELKAAKEITQAILDIAQTISDAILERQLQQLDKKDKALKASHDNEIRFIEQSGMTSLQQTKAKAKVEAEFEAQQKKIDRDRSTAQKKAAKINRDISIANIIAKTAEAIMADLTIPVGGEILAVATAAIGAAELARVIATPLPQYAKGRGKGKDEFAIVGEAGREAILRGDGRLEITPNAPTKTFLKADDMVLNNSELMSAIYRTAMVKLADGSKVSTDSIQMALLEKTDEEIIELKGLRQDLRAKNLTANYYGLSGFESYRQSNIR